VCSLTWLDTVLNNVA